MLTQQEEEKLRGLLGAIDAAGATAQDLAGILQFAAVRKRLEALQSRIDNRVAARDDEVRAASGEIAALTDQITAVQGDLRNLLGK